MARESLRNFRECCPASLVVPKFSTLGGCLLYLAKRSVPEAPGLLIQYRANRTRNIYRLPFSREGDKIHFVISRVVLKLIGPANVGHVTQDSYAECFTITRRWAIDALASCRFFLGESIVIAEVLLVYCLIIVAVQFLHIIGSRLKLGKASPSWRMQICFDPRILQSSLLDLGSLNSQKIIQPCNLKLTEFSLKKKKEIDSILVKESSTVWGALQLSRASRWIRIWPQNSKIANMDQFIKNNNNPIIAVLEGFSGSPQMNSGLLSGNRLKIIQLRIPCFTRIAARGITEYRRDRVPGKSRSRSERGWLMRLRSAR